jgi:hypothetical protein
VLLGYAGYRETVAPPAPQDEKLRRLGDRRGKLVSIFVENPRPIGRGAIAVRRNRGSVYKFFAEMSGVSASALTAQQLSGIARVRKLVRCGCTEKISPLSLRSH